MNMSRAFLNLESDQTVSAETTQAVNQFILQVVFVTIFWHCFLLLVENLLQNKYLFYDVDLSFDHENNQRIW